MARRATALGTLAAPGWSRDWLARVDKDELALGRRICGAMSPNMTPCTLVSDHRSGRCRYHGGVPDVGPPNDNENARVHGLYSRRLQRCGTHCPLWESCAFSGEDVLALPVKQRPHCAYEREEYAALIRHYFKEELDPPEDGFDDEDDCRSSRRYSPSFKMECPEPFLMHQLIMLTIMTTRAAAVLSHGALTDAVEVASANYNMKSAKPGAALEAFIRIMREYRGLRSVIDTKKLVPPPQMLGIGSRMKPLLKKAEGAIEEALVETGRARNARDEEAIRLAAENARTPESEEARKLGSEEEADKATESAAHMERTSAGLGFAVSGLAEELLDSSVSEEARDRGS